MTDNENVAKLMLKNTHTRQVSEKKFYWATDVEFTIIHLLIEY